MKDRELLELAAIAASNNAKWWSDSTGMLVTTDDCNGTKRWNPLDDNGDALRLAVRRHIRIEQDEERSLSIAMYHNDGWAAQEPHDGDPEKATRRAIVVAVVHQYLSDNKEC